MHAYSNDRAYLFQKDKVILTTDTGRLWSELPLPMQPNIMAIPVLYTHPLQSDWLIFIGSKGCSPNSNECQAVAHYSTDHGRHWVPFETYVRNCGWARDNELKIDARLILCESYRDKKGSQIMFGGMNPLELWSGGDFYRNRKKLFDSVVGHAKFSEYVIVGEVRILCLFNPVR
jgi:Sortilin, neurotensin receptor 3,